MSSWIPPLVRAVPAIALALAVTFSADHSAALGLLTFGIFAVVTGIGIIVVAVLGSQGPARTVAVIHGVIGVLAGIAALTTISGGLPYLVLLVSAWAVLTGTLEVYRGVQSRAMAPMSARDAMFVGAATVILAIAIQLVPPTLAQSYEVEGTEHLLTASVVVVGLLGAYWAIIGVYLAIAAASPRPSSPADADRTPVESSPEAS